MQINKAQQEFERVLKARGKDVRNLQPETGFDAMLAFYRDIRADGCDLDQDGDMLLYQWGTHDWGEGQHFEFDITRQLISEPGEDENIWQLHLTFMFTPTDSLKDLGVGDKWCSLPGDVSAFEAYVRTHPAFAAVATRTDATVELRYEQVG